ncbi:MAG: Spx/MgsR family RNA polymerase-binding regulatory protein [Bacteroidia bacterium]|nr:Spx/MgsR family RNA polymerase-binding regulatory protein [Bacteroidia bacterium]
MKKAFTWLEEKGINYTFHNYQTSQVTAEKLSEWINHLGLETIINKKGTTYKKLDAETQASLDSPETAIPVIMSKTSMIKRPIVEYKGTYLVGFNASEWTTQIK